MRPPIPACGSQSEPSHNRAPCPLITPAASWVCTPCAATPDWGEPWPEPDNGLAVAEENGPTWPAPSVPASAPVAPQRPRPLTPRLAASPTPMIRPASITSRNTMMSAPNMPLFRDDDALGRVGVEIAEEFVTSGCQRSDAHDPFRLAGNDLLNLQRRALEFLRARVLVGDVGRYPFARGHADFLRLGPVVAGGEVELLRDGMDAPPSACRQHDRQSLSPDRLCRSPSLRE